MKKLEFKKAIKDFGKNVRSYAEYLMKVDFGELFVNVLILLCILALSCFAYIPSGIIKGIFKGLLRVFEFKFTSTFLYLCDWVFDVLGLLCCVIAFILLFNMRFSDIEEYKKQFEDKPKKEDIVAEKDELVLPKTKKTK